MSLYQKKHSPTHNCYDHQPFFISFIHLLWSILSFLFNLHAWQSFCTISLQVLFGLPLVLEPSTLYSIHFFTQSSPLCNTCLYYRNLFGCSMKIMSSIPGFFLSSWLVMSVHLFDHFHLCPLKCNLFFSLQATSHFHAAYYLTHNYWTVSLL